MIKGFIFDLDNTLIDDNRGWDKALRETCYYISNRFHIEYNAEEIYKAYKKISDYMWSNYSTYLAVFLTRQEKREYVWEKTFEHLGCYLDEIQVKDITSVFSKYREDNVFAFDYAKELLEEIRQMGFKTIICTDGEADLQIMKCKKVEIDGLIEKVISATNLGCTKPDKKVFDQCVAYFGVDAAELMYIGDDKIKDIQGALNVGMQGILVNSSDNITLKTIKDNLEMIIKGCG